MGVDLRKIRAGDEVTVRAVVNIVHGDGSLTVVANADGCESSVSPCHVVSHTPKPRPLQVGDKVNSQDWRDARLTILCTHGPWAWLADAEGSTIQLPLSQLVRVDD